MIDYQEFCDRFWIAANQETKRMLARSGSGSGSDVSSNSSPEQDDAEEDGGGGGDSEEMNSDRFSFARSLSIPVHAIVMCQPEGSCSQVEMADEQESVVFGLDLH